MVRRRGRRIRPEEQAPGGGIGLQQRGGSGEGIAQYPADPETLSGEVDRWCQNVPQRQAAIAALGQGQPRHRAGHAGAEQAAGGPLPVHRAIGAQEQVGPGRQGRLFAEIHRHGGATPQTQLGIALQRAASGPPPVRLRVTTAPGSRRRRCCPPGAGSPPGRRPWPPPHPPHCPPARRVAAPTSEARRSWLATTPRGDQSG